MPILSVVVPVYNSEKFLRQCIEFIQGQTFANFELICVDDGSTDNSRLILHEYAREDSRIKIYTKNNDGNGAAGARNLGLEHATGQYIHFLDSDDFFSADMFERMIDKAIKTSADIVICKAEIFDQIHKKIVRDVPSIQFKYAPHREWFSYQDCPEYIFQIADNVVWNKLFNRELIDTHKLKFESVPISDDQYVPCLALVLAKRISIIDEPFVKYRVNIGTSQVDGYHLHPTSGYVASYSIVKKMREIGVYESVKQSYLNHELSLMREYFDRMLDLENLRFLYDSYKREVFPKLGAVNLSNDYFYDKRLADWYRMINCESLEKILFNSARGYGNKHLTAVLRFQVPYKKIKPGSRIILTGNKLISRYWYAQLLLSDYCEVVAWVDDTSNIPKNLQYDAIITAK